MDSLNGDSQLLNTILAGLSASKSTLQVVQTRLLSSQHDINNLPYPARNIRMRQVFQCFYKSTSCGSGAAKTPE